MGLLRFNVFFKGLLLNVLVDYLYFKFFEFCNRFLICFFYFSFVVICFVGFRKINEIILCFNIVII